MLRRVVALVVVTLFPLATLLPGPRAGASGSQPFVIDGWTETVGLSRGEDVWGTAVGFGDHIFYLTSASDRAVLVADINPDGSIARWRRTLSPPPAPHPQILFDSVLIGDFWVIPGHGRSLVGKLDPAGEVTWWHDAPSSNYPASVSRAVANDGNRIYSVGGGNRWVTDHFTGEVYANVETAVLSPDGTLSNWTALTPLPEPIHSGYAAVIDDFLYMFGGIKGLGPNGEIIGGAVDLSPARRVRRAPIRLDGTIGAWELVGELLVPRPSLGVLRYGGTLHIVGGGVHGLILDAVESVVESDLGVTAAHEFSAPIPRPTQGPRTAVVRNYGYVFGGNGTFGPPPHLNAYYARLGEPPNAPPTADAGPDQTVECDGPDGATVALNGSASSDPDGDPLTFTWNGPFGRLGGGTGDAIVQVTLPPGVHAITLTVMDDDGEMASDELVVTVQDTTAPSIQARLEPLARGDDDSDDKSGDGTSDDKSDEHSGGKRRYRVVASATDACDVSPTVLADLNGQPVTDGQLVEIKLERHGHKTKIKWKKGLLVLETPEAVLSVHASDVAGNSATEQVVLRRSKDDDES